MDTSNETSTQYLLRRTLHNRVLSQELIASAQRVVNRGRDLRQALHERRRLPDFFYHLAKFPRMHRYLPLSGSDGDPLQIETEERPEGMVAHVSGEVDLANVTRLRAALQPALSNCRDIILDISHLRYIDSTGLHALIDAHKALQQDNCQLVVVGASPGITKVMRILHVDEMMPLVPTVDEAVDLLRPEPSAAASDG